MKLQSYQQMLSEYGILQLEADDETSRKEMLEMRRYSVILEGGFMEFDNLNKWIRINLAPEPIIWLFYSKIAYDYGFAEYFFANESEARAVAEIIPRIYTVYPHSNPPNLTVKSNGYNEDVAYDPNDGSAITPDSGWATLPRIRSMTSAGASLVSYLIRKKGINDCPCCRF
ncbi:hypothetical protein ACQ86N_46625 [Puia sp. P3]|uniref:hypothetical protein n=1 Tax=Puia sp. P3 TaxID=3423952 RepID=UPI003D67AD3B